MAVSNKEIMMNYRMMNNIPEDKELYTYAVWLSKGYQVKRGESCRHRVEMWKYKPHTEKAVTKAVEPSEGNVEQGQEKKKRSNSCFMKTVYLFEKNQVEEIVK